jgi:hypothetical protein
MKRICLVLLLVVALLAGAVSVGVTAADVEAVTPAPPSWVGPEEYLVFEGSAAYRPENWEKILKLRASAEAGDFGREETTMALYKELNAGAHNDEGLFFELLLLSYGEFLGGYPDLDYDKYVETGDPDSYYPYTISKLEDHDEPTSSFPEGSREYPLLYAWYVRAGVMAQRVFHAF